MIAGVALGGRASLFGPALGAMAVGWGQSSLGSSWPGGWIYILGLVFILVTLFVPMGLSSLFSKVRGMVWRPRGTPNAISTTETPAREEVMK